jgi:hypothetical protein
MRRFAVFLLLVCGAGVYPCSALAHGVLGDYIFIEPNVTQDPTPANELDILQPTWVRSSDANTYSIASSIEKVLWIDQKYMPRASVGASTSWSYVSPYLGASFNGFGGVTMFAKYAFFYSLEHEFLLATLIQLQIPAGNKNIQSENHPSLGPVLLWEKALGDLPNALAVKYLRPLAVQSDFGYVPAVRGHTSHHMFADAVIEYSFPYLSNNVKDIGLQQPLRSMFLFNEINYDQLITGPSGQTFPTLLATPGVAYVSYHYELAVATQFALNNASRAGNHAAVLGLLDIFYDSLFPEIGNWTINRGFGG